MKMYCLTINNSHYNKIVNLNYIPVGLGDKISSNKFLTDNIKIKIWTNNPNLGLLNNLKSANKPMINIDKKNNP